MKRWLFGLIGLFLFASVTQAQRIVYDKAKKRQWQAMELGKRQFYPWMYYFLFHNSYRKHSQNMLPLREEAAATAIVNSKYTNDEVDALKEQSTSEIEKTADCTIDAAYILYKKDFDNLETSILNSLSEYMKIAGTSKMGTYETLINEYKLIEQNIQTTHSAYMENAYRQQLYIEFKKKLQKLQARINAMMKLAYAETILKK